MNKSSLLIAVAAFAALASTGVRAESPALSSQFAIQIEGNRTRAEVMAESSTVSASRSLEPAGSRVAALPKSTLDVKSVRDEAVQALRLGKIPSGELSF